VRTSATTGLRCRSFDPCCGDPDRCCNDDNPCCGSTDPCCNVSDPCCGSPDPCCGINCDDGDPCNGVEACVDGACVPGTPIDCDDGDPCTIDSCDPASGCVHVPSVTATLERTPREISAFTVWPVLLPSEYAISEIAVSWNPPECPGHLVIKDLVGEYVPPSEGMLVKQTDTDWWYGAFSEPQTEKHPGLVTVHIAAKWGDTELATTDVRVKPVHEWLTQAHQHGADGFFHAPTESDYERTYHYISWKYAQVLETSGGEFDDVSITTDQCVDCGVPASCVAACTTIWDEATFAVQTFSGTENRTASIIGHELTHTVGILLGSECTAYTWEWDHRFDTGIDQDQTYLTDVQNNMNAECD